jgi:serine protease Do
MNTSDTPKRFSPRGLFDKARNGRLATTFLVLSALSIGILAGSVLTSSVSGKEAQHVDSTDARALTIPSPVNLSNAFSQIAKQIGPAVVNINTESLPKQSAVTKRPRRGAPQGNGDDQGQGQAAPDQGDMQDFFNRFFGGGGGQGGGQGDDDAQGGGKREALGSGYIVDSRGYIITNNHVVDKADKIYVKLSTDPDGGPGDKGRPAIVIGVDTETDIAVIKIDAKEPLPVVKMGNSDGAQVGDWVLAIGSPFGLSHTVSAGIVSAKNRSIDEPSATGVANQFQKFIQTDAAINPGNSGGPLVDMSGSVIGMNTAIYTQSMGSQGVGFAMPSNIIISVYNQLISPEHKVTRGSIGIQFQAAPSSAVNRVYGSAAGGVIVGSVVPNGGASKAGLQPDDVIVSVDGRSIKDGDDLVADISGRKVGSSVKIGYLRNGKPNSTSVVIGDRAKTYADLGANDDSPAATPEVDAGQNKLGITVSAAPAAAISKLGLKSGGVMVTSVRSGSFADEINLLKGTIITEINHKAVTDEASYRTIVSGLKSGDDVVFVVRDPRIQGGGNSYVGGTLP